MSFRCQRWGYFFLFGEVWNLRQLPDTILIFVVVVVAAAVLKILLYRFCPSGPECWKLNVKIRTSPLLTDFPSALHNGHQHDILARILQALIHMPLAVIHSEVTATLPGVFSVFADLLQRCDYYECGCGSLMSSPAALIPDPPQLDFPSPAEAVEGWWPLFFFLWCSVIYLHLQPLQASYSHVHASR